MLRWVFVAMYRVYRHFRTVSIGPRQINALFFVLKVIVIGGRRIAWWEPLASGVGIGYAHHVENSPSGTPGDQPPFPRPKPKKALAPAPGAGSHDSSTGFVTANALILASHTPAFGWQWRNSPATAGLSAQHGQRAPRHLVPSDTDAPTHERPTPPICTPGADFRPAQRRRSRRLGNLRIASPVPDFGAENRWVSSLGQRPAKPPIFFVTVLLPKGLLIRRFCHMLYLFNRDTNPAPLYRTE